MWEGREGQFHELFPLPFVTGVEESSVSRDPRTISSKFPAPRRRRSLGAREKARGEKEEPRRRFRRRGALTREREAVTSSQYSPAGREKTRQSNG